MINKIEIGQKYTKLTVVRKTSKRSRGYVVWECRCDCGNTKLVKSSNLTFGFVKSCGCLPTGCGRKLPVSVASSNKLFHRYKRDAQTRNIEFKLTKEQFLELTQQECFYCNTVPKQKTKDNMKYNGYFIYNGIDRVDNSKGYVLENCVPCCKKCNSSKGNISKEQAIKFLKFLGYEIKETK